jgi:hypothetical protein
MPTTITGNDGVSQVQAGAVESGDLPAEAYQKNNILGTVSESGGVPTGSIIERGSNANGEFIKYADGTMICTSAYSPSSSASGTVVTLPSAFINSSFQVTCTPGQISGGDFDAVANAEGKDENASSIRVKHSRIASNSVTASTIGGFYIAIGRWY